MSNSNSISESNNDDNDEKKLIVLVSEGVSDRTQAGHQRRALMLLKAKNIPFETVNGMDPNQRQRRNELFQISGIRAHYPQFFFSLSNGSQLEFFGPWETLEALNEMGNDVPKEILEANPDLKTWNQVFHNVV